MDIFSKIAAGEIPSYKCAENEEFYAFLDINPLVVGHTLVIPRREVDYIFDMGPEGGKAGGTIVAAGTPEELADNPDSVTGPFLKEVLF